MDTVSADCVGKEQALMKLADRAKGHWDAILAAAGIDESDLDGKHHACPSCGGKDRFRYVRDDAGHFFCSDSYGDGFELLRHLKGMDFAEAARTVEGVIGKDADWKPEPHVVTYAERLQRVAKRVPRSKYLESRCLEMPPGVYFARGVEYYEDDVRSIFPAMLAPITRNGTFLTYHATYLLSGAKAPVHTPRKMLPGPQTAGAAIELYAAAGVMGVAEGIETAIAAKMLHGMPVWSLISTSLMKAWEPPSIAKQVTIFADNDRNFAGHAAAYHLAHKLALRGVVVTIAIPEIHGDWNDVLMQQRGMK